MRKLVVGSRGSRLARAQTAIVVEQLRERHPGIEIAERTISTRGDELPDLPLERAGVVGFFTSEIERRLLEGEIDLAVHSCKDLPAGLAEGCTIGAVPPRETPEDALIAGPGQTLDTLPAGARIGTGSLRRAALLRRARPDVEPAPIRGNVDTRLAKLDRGECDALILAVAGLRRLGCEDRISCVLGPGLWYHAVGQGALAVEARSDDVELLELVRVVDDPVSHQVVDAERAFLRRLGGGCHVPVGVTSQIDGETLRLGGMIAGIDGEPFITGGTLGPLARPEPVGVELAELLLAEGADELLKGSK